MLCGPGTYYNPSTELCDFPANVDTSNCRLWVCEADGDTFAGADCDEVSTFLYHDIFIFMCCIIRFTLSNLPCVKLTANKISLRPEVVDRTHKKKNRYYV